MVLSRLQHLLETFLPVLFFTFTDLVDPISVFSVAGLVAAFVVLVLAIHHLAFLYIALVTFFPGVVDYGLPGLSFILDGYLLVAAAWTASVLYLWDIIDHVVSSPLFGIHCVVFVICVSYFVYWHLKTTIPTRTMRSEWRRRRDAEISQLVALNRHIGCQLNPFIRIKMKQIETLIRQSDISERQRKRLLEERELEIRHLEAERDSLAHQAHELQNQLLRRLAAANKKHDALAAARSADIQRFNEERAALEAENAALKGAVTTAVAQQHDHKQRCREDRKLTKKRLEQQATAFEVAREASAQRLAAEELRTSSLKAENDLLTERLASADTAREAMIAAHQAQIEQYDQKLAEHEAQYATLQYSFQSTNVKRRLHLAHCEEENASARARNEDLAAQLAAKNTSYEELKANYDAVVHKNLEMSEAYKVMEAKLKAAERELYLERLAHRANTDYQVLPTTKCAPGLVSESTLVNLYTKPCDTPSSSSKPLSKPSKSDFVQGSSRQTPSSPPLDSRELSQRHAIFASGVQNSSTPYRAESVPKSAPQLTANPPSDQAVHRSPDPEVVEAKYRRFIVAMGNTSTPWSAARAKQALRPVATGQKQQIARRRVESDVPTVAPSSPISEEQSSADSSPDEESSGHDVFAKGIKDSSIPRGARCQHVHGPSRSSKPSTISPEAGPLPRSASVDDRSRYTRFMAHLNNASTPRDMQERLKRLVPKSRRAPARAKSPVNALAVLPEEEIPDDPPQLPPGSPESSSLARNEDRYRVFTSGLGTTTIPACVALPSHPPRGPSPPPPALPPSLPHPSSPPPPPPLPLTLLPQAKGKPRSQLQTSDSFFHPQEINSAPSKTSPKFELKSRFPHLPEFIEGSSKDGLPLGKTPAMVRWRRESRYVPGSPETPCHQPTSAGAGMRALLDRLEGELGPGRRPDEDEDDQ